MNLYYSLKPTDRLFPVTKHYLSHEMDRGCKAAGVKRIRIHDLRHPYVKHTTKNIILKSRNPKLPRKLLQLGISAFVIL